MVASIRILPDALADQIAAGEVVERPASVVKELIENAIDAAAARVTIDISDGGLQLIRVSDDGCGMVPEDAELCVQRHATSKLRTSEDLFDIRTLGFRGEALPSIASVARFALVTRTRDHVAGTELRVDGGSRPQLRPAGGAPGTTIEVRDLFYNVPARLKFLKSKATEGAHVANACLRAALAYPELSLVFTRDGRAAQSFLAKQTFGERVAAAFPDDALTEYETEFEGATLRAALGAPERARSGAAHLHLFVNRRPVRDQALARCIAFAYGSVLPPGRFPVGAIHLELPASEVDVNVHPQKLEVRFARGRALLDALTRSLARKLGTSAWSGPAARAQNYWQDRLGANTAWQGLPMGAAQPVVPYAAQPPQAVEPDAWGLASSADATPPAAVSGVAEAVGAGLSAAGDSPALLGSRGFFGSLRVLGQARSTFLVCEAEHGIVILDQHAADERVRFDQLRRAYASRAVRIQRLLFPERVEVTELEATLVEQHHAEFEHVGLHCSRLGPTTVAVAGVPALLARAAPTRLLRDMLAELTRSGERAFADAVDMALATMACHAAIRAGDVLSEHERGALLRALDAVDDFQGHCPHGRPVLCTLPFSELEQRLGR